MIFLPKCRSKKLGMINIILASFCSFLNWDGANIQPCNYCLSISEQLCRNRVTELN